jgi:hypothetical protein
MSHSRTTPPLASFLKGPPIFFSQYSEMAGVSSMFRPLSTRLMSSVLSVDMERQLGAYLLGVIMKADANKGDNSRRVIRMVLQLLTLMLMCLL